MGDARSRSGRGESRVGWGGGEGQWPRSRYDERWLEHMVRGLYESAVNEPLPERLLDLVRRIPGGDETIPQGHGSRMPVRNVPRVRENIGVLHRLLNFQEKPTTGQRISNALEGRINPLQASGGSSLDSSDRVRRWRVKADEVRTAAESMSSGSARHTLLRLAHDYEALAESLELLIRERPSRERGTG